MSGRKIGQLVVLVGVGGAASYAGYSITKRSNTVSHSRLSKYDKLKW